MDRSVTCTACGASTALPADLRVPTFACAFCHAQLRTADYAGVAAVSADALVGHVRAAVMGQGASGADAPRFQGQSDATRQSACVRCRAPLAIPLDLTVKQVRCAACGHDQWVHEHIPDAERFALDMQRQLAGNQALRALKTEGIACPQCGGKNDAPDDGSVQVPCRFCGAAILLGGHVDASAVARARLKQGVMEMKDDIVRAQKRRDRIVLVVILSLVALVLAIAAAVALFSQLRG